MSESDAKGCLFDVFIAISALLLGFWLGAILGADTPSWVQPPQSGDRLFIEAQTKVYEKSDMVHEVEQITGMTTVMVKANENGKLLVTYSEHEGWIIWNSQFMATIKARSN
jgi:hypothetical protein